ncbi:MAG: peptide chain release factor N(5)-glutamine methyltransferase [bacterium]|nr:peptide chain release factor N(5)-glutamine methyltransferase [bacterium]
MNVQQALVTGMQLLRDFKVGSAELDAEILLAHSVSKERTKLYADAKLPLTDSQKKLYQDLLARRASKEPVAYLVGQREFYNITLLTNRHVLIPRPETETLVEIALDRINKIGKRRVRVLDIGTGSGAIALAIAKNSRKAKVTAADISNEALDVARHNAKRLRLAQSLSFKRSDLLAQLPGQFDLIVANLPYLTTEQIRELPGDIREYEPNLALSGGPDGLHVYEKLLQQLTALGTGPTRVLCEIGPNLKSGFTHLVGATIGPECSVAYHKDMSGRIRVAEFVMLTQ